MTLRDDVEKILDNEQYNEYGSVDNIFFFEKYEHTDNSELHKAFKSADIVVEYVDQYGGEGMGDEYWTVYKFTRDGEIEYLKFDGWYCSYVGPEFNERRWVKPVEVLVTKFVDFVDA